MMSLRKIGGKQNIWNPDFSNIAAQVYSGGVTSHNMLDYIGKLKSDITPLLIKALWWDTTCAGGNGSLQYGLGMYGYHINTLTDGPLNLSQKYTTVVGASSGIGLQNTEAGNPLAVAYHSFHFITDPDTGLLLPLPQFFELSAQLTAGTAYTSCDPQVDIEIYG
jgi:hypothetical protein